MGDYLVDVRDVRFCLYEHLGVERLLEYPRYQEFNKEMLDMVIDQALKQAKEVFAPLNSLGDEEGVVLEKGRVTLPQEFIEAYRLHAESGWVGAKAAPQWGGQGLPGTVMMPVQEFFIGACHSANGAPSLTRDAAHLVESFGNEEMQQTYLEKMYSGQWTGTMCMTEPQAGSYVADTKCQAKKEGDHYKIVGTKSFITCGDHNLTDNIIHLVLARTEGAPPGIKGISLFLVPKYRVNPDGSVGDLNDVQVGGVEKKMGMHASPTCVLNFGENEDCIGYVIGEEGEGIKYMFQMMNEQRIAVGIQSLAISAAAYLNALQYSQERIQGVEITAAKDPNAPRVPIVHHPDVRRMLLMMKASTEGMRALLYSTAFYHDLAQCVADEAERMKYQGYVDLLTPICKAWSSDLGFRVTEWAMQCLGGYGYCGEYPVEQYMRDIKITSIYEGANGIQALDLLRRKVSMKGGILFSNFISMLDEFIENNRAHPSLGGHISRLEKAKDVLVQNTARFGELTAGGDIVYPVLHACPYLEMFGDVAVAHLLLDQALIAQTGFDAICE